MRTKYVFDVDGTLTPSRGIIDLEFKSWFNAFCLVNDVYLVTGSDRAKTIEQISETTYNLCKRVYNCSVSDVYSGSEKIRSSDWTSPNSLHLILDGWLQASKFPHRTGNHKEERPGMLNFSVVGRNASIEDRKEYVEFDTSNRERESIAHVINSYFEDITATIGGETGIDIHPTGADKSQILEDFQNYREKIHFFGDAIHPYGNDWSIANAVDKRLNGTSHHVKNWNDTWNKLKEFSND
jgi:phosphomannomutase